MDGMAWAGTQHAMQSPDFDAAGHDHSNPHIRVSSPWLKISMPVHHTGLLLASLLQHTNKHQTTCAPHHVVLSPWLQSTQTTPCNTHSFKAKLQLQL
jgi:hypothetical protein